MFNSTRLPIINSITQFRILTTMRKKPFENIVGKGKNAGKPTFPAMVFYSIRDHHVLLYKITIH